MQFKIPNYVYDEIFAKDILVLKFIIESRTGVLVRHYSHTLYNPSEKQNIGCPENMTTKTRLFQLVFLLLWFL